MTQGALSTPGLSLMVSFSQIPDKLICIVKFVGLQPHVGIVGEEVVGNADGGAVVGNDEGIAVGESFCISRE